MTLNRIYIGLIAVLLLIGIVVKAPFASKPQTTETATTTDTVTVTASTTQQNQTAAVVGAVNTASTAISEILQKPTETTPTEKTKPVFTKETLKQYDGSDPSLPIYIAFDGNVYDVTAGRKFYQPGGTYHFLAGTDGSTLLHTFGGDIIKKKYKVVGTYQ